MGRPAIASPADLSILDLPGSDGIPLYVRLAMSLRTRILQGEYKAGDRLPTFEEIAQAYGVAMNTVRKAVQMLTGESLLASGRGSGTVVTGGDSPGVAPRLRETIRDPLALSPDVVIAILESNPTRDLPAELQESYSLAPRYQRVLKTHGIGGVPFALLDIYVDLEAFRRFPLRAERTHKLSQLLRDDKRTQLASSREELTIAHADQRLSTLLRYPIAAPLVRLRRWLLRGDGTVAYACVALYRSDMFVWDTTVAEAGADHYGTHIIPKVKTR